MVIEKEDFEILKGYHELMSMILSNQACSGLSLQMQNDIFAILKKYGRLYGCTSCNSSMMRHILEAEALYVQNVERYESKKKIKNASNGKKDKDTEGNRD